LPHCRQRHALRHDRDWRFRLKNSLVRNRRCGRNYLLRRLPLNIIIPPINSVRALAIEAGSISGTPPRGGGLSAKAFAAQAAITNISPQILTPLTPMEQSSFFSIELRSWKNGPGTRGLYTSPTLHSINA
jgi:hypothetical protein